MSPVLKELFTVAAFVFASVGAAHAQSGPPGMPGLTRPVNTPQEVAPGNTSLSLGASRLPTPEAAAGGGSGVTREMVDTSRQAEPVPASLTRDSVSRTSAIDPQPIPAAEALMESVSYQRSQLVPGRTAVNELTLSPGRNELVQVARGHLNRFVTPFARPTVKSTSTSTTTNVEGSIVYVATASVDPVGLFIVDADNPANAISLTLMPRDVPPVSMTLAMDQFAEIPVLASRPQESTAQADSFVDMIRESFRAIAMGEIPQGFGMRKVNGFSRDMPECVLPGLQATPAQVLSSGTVIVIVSKLTNLTRIPQSVVENRCAADSVLAVAAWPYVELMPGQSTELYIAVRRDAPAASNARPSVL